MSSAWYNKGKYAVLKGASGDINLNDDTIKIMLVKSSYTFSASHQFVADVVASECDFTNYVRKTLSNKAFTEAATSYFDNTVDPTWSAAGGATNNTIGGCIIFKDTGSDAASQLLCFLDPADLTTNGGDVTVAFAAGGIASLT